MKNKAICEKKVKKWKFRFEKLRTTNSALKNAKLSKTVNFLFEISHKGTSI